MYIPVHRTSSICPREYAVKYSPYRECTVKYFPLRDGYTENQLFQYNPTEINFKSNTRHKDFRPPFVLCQSSSGDPPWILKGGGLESAGQILIFSNGKEKNIFFSEKKKNLNLRFFEKNVVLKIF